MKYKNIVPAAIVSSALMASVPNVANAVEYQLSGMACDSVFAGGVSEKTQGLENRLTTQDVWVACPVMKFGESDDFRAQVNLLNNSNFIEDVTCHFRERKGGKEVRSSAGSVRIPANSYSEDMFWEGRLNTNTHANIMCKLPTGVAIESLSFSSESSGDGGSGSPTNTNVAAKACETAPSGYYGSSSDKVEFKNGLVANNYNGHSWSSSDPATVFRTRDNTWHVITDTDTENSEVFKLDVVREPTSCMEPEYGAPQKIRTLNSGEKVLVFSDIEITVGPSCTINTNSKLLIYGTDWGSNYWLLDIKTADNCRIKDWREL